MFSVKSSRKFSAFHAGLLIVCVCVCECVCACVCVLECVRACVRECMRVRVHVYGQNFALYKYFNHYFTSSLFAR